MLFPIFQAIPVHAASILIAAADSSSTSKSAATAVCSGSSDQNVINTYLKAGNTVQLAAGDYYINNFIMPQSATRLTGQGNTSIIHLSNAAILVSNVNNVELDNFQITGAGWSSGAVFITALNVTVSGFYIHNISNNAKGCDSFTVYANSYGVVSNTVFSKDDANNPDGFGFMINGEGSNPKVEDITFYKCTVENAGVASTRLTLSDGQCWITGFNLGEDHGMSVDKVQVINCSVNGSWESDYHVEYAVTKTNIVIMDSAANYAGLKTGGALYGAGFLLPVVAGRDDIILSNNTAVGNKVSTISGGKIPDVLIWDSNISNYDVYSPSQNIIIPAAAAVTSRINQGNCIGLMATSGNNLTLYLYSSDNNPVSQQIDLGAIYIGNDGNTYTFNGTKIVAQFNDFTVIRLVKSTNYQSQSPVVATNAASGITATGGVLNGALTTLGNVGQVTLSFEWGTTTNYGSSISAVPTIVTAVPASFTSSLSGLTAGTTYHYRAVANAGSVTVYGADQQFTSGSQ